MHFVGALCRRAPLPLPRTLTNHCPEPIFTHSHQFYITIVLLMSTNDQTTCPSASSNFTQIFNAAIDEYKILTGKDLSTHPFATAFDTCTTPDSILDEFRGQVQALNTFRKGNDRLMKWLKPTVRILFLLLAMPGEGIGLVSPSFLPCILPQFLSLSCLLPLNRFSLVLVFFSG